MFGEKISALAWKNPLNPSAQDLKIQWEIQFSTFFVVGQNAPKFFFTIEIWTFSFQNCFQNQFWTSGSGQTENTQIRICVFSVWPLPEVQNWFWKQFWNEKVHISIVKKNFGAFWPTTKKVENWISHCIFKSCAEGFRGFFHARALIFSPNTLYLPTKQPWGAPNFWFWLHPFIRIG